MIKPPIAPKLKSVSTSCRVKWFWYAYTILSYKCSSAFFVWIRRLIFQSPWYLFCFSKHSHTRLALLFFVVLKYCIQSEYLEGIPIFSKMAKVLWVWSFTKEDSLNQSSFPHALQAAMKVLMRTTHKVYISSCTLLMTSCDSDCPQIVATEEKNSDDSKAKCLRIAKPTFLLWLQFSHALTSGWI